MSQPSPGKRSTRRSEVELEGSSRKTLQAGIGGAGGGTIMVAVAQAAGTDTLLGQVILYAAPTASVIAGALFYELKFRAERMTQKSHVKAARKTLVKQLSDPNTSDKYKQELATMIEELDRTVANAELARVKSRHGLLNR